MKSNCLVWCLILLSFLSLSLNLEVLMANDINTLVKGNNAFAIDLYKILATDKGNLFFSPYSISSALAMTYAGARGRTAKQMADVLHFTLPDEKLHMGFYNLSRLIESKDKDYQLSIANALWGQKNYKFNQEFIDLMNKYYEAGFKEVDYINDAEREKTRKIINTWVEDNTNKKIKDLIGPRDLNSLTRLVLTNAIYFKGKWEIQFDPKETKEMPFYVSEKEKVNVPMMRVDSEFNYTEDENVQVLELPYVGKDLSMIVILPKPQLSLSSLEKKLSLDMLDSWISNLSKSKVEVYIPKFKLTKRFVLNDPLIKLGMVDAFDEMFADFSGMTPKPDLYITSVIHQAFVEVNEEGTEAAAATAVIMGTKAFVKSYKFLADRPFIFMIRDLRSNSILFIGRLTKPGK